MDNRDEIGSGGKTERAIFILSGLIMGGLGSYLAWVSYGWTENHIKFEYKYVWICVTACLAFFMLRGAYYALFRRQRKRRFDLETTRVVGEY